MPGTSPKVPLLVAITSFNRYTAQVDGLADLDVARVMGEYYELAAATITGGWRASGEVHWRRHP